MKNKKIVFIVVGIVLVIVFGGGLLYHFRDRRTYELDLPNVDVVDSITLEDDDFGIAITDKDDIKRIIDVLLGVKRVTDSESIQDYPVNANDVIKIEFYLVNDGNCRTTYVYERRNKYYIEQTYNGIYGITEEEYKIIEEYLD